MKTIKCPPPEYLFNVNKNEIHVLNVFKVSNVDIIMIVWVMMSLVFLMFSLLIIHKLK